MKSILQITYVSTAVGGFAECQISELRKQWQSANVKRDIDSVLVNIGDSFLQLLEGERSMVEAVYKLIRQDPRHANIIQLTGQTVRERLFAGLSLGYAALHPMHAQELLAANNQLPSGQRIGCIDAEGAKTLLYGALGARRGLSRRADRRTTTSGPRAFSFASPLSSGRPLYSR